MEKTKEKSDRAVIQVQTTWDEHEILRQAAYKLSIGTSTYVRMKALEAARDGK